MSGSAPDTTDLEQFRVLYSRIYVLNRAIIWGVLEQPDLILSAQVEFQAALDAIEYSRDSRYQPFYRWLPSYSSQVAELPLPFPLPFPDAVLSPLENLIVLEMDALPQANSLYCSSTIAVC